MGEAGIEWDMKSRAGIWGSELGEELLRQRGLGLQKPLVRREPSSSDPEEPRACMAAMVRVGGVRRRKQGGTGRSSGFGDHVRNLNFVQGEMESQ